MRNVVSTTDIGCKHGLFNYPVGHIARSRSNLLYAPVFVANDLRFSGFKIDCAPFLPRFQQRLVDAMQIEQVSHTVLALHRLRSSGIAQNGRHLGIGESRMTPHQCRVKLIGLNLAIGRHKHVAHHAKALYLGI